MTNILLVLLIILNSVLLFEHLPAFKRMLRQTESLKNDIQSSKVDRDSLTSDNRLLRSQLQATKARIAGLELEREAAEREGENWKNVAIERKRLLVSRGYEKG